MTSRYQSGGSTMVLDVRNRRAPGGRPQRRLRAAFAGALAFGLSALLAAPASAQQTGQVTGRVLDAQSGAPLSEVQVYISGLQLGSLSRADGRFIILNVPAGQHELTAERIGLTTATQSVNVTAGGTATVEFRLESAALGLDEIVVTGTAGSARRREIGNSISQLDVAEVPYQPVAVTELLQGAAPGIELTGGGGQLGQGKQIRLRGNSSVS